MVLAKHKMCVAMTLDKGFCSSHSPGLCIAELCGLSERQFENEAGRIVKDCPELHGAFGCLLLKKTRRRWITLIKFFGLSDVAGIDSVSGISFLCFADDERDRNATFTWSLCKSADRTFTATCNEVRNDVRAACSALTLVNERQLQYVESADEEPYDVEMPDAVHVHDAELAVDPQGHHDRGCDDSGVDGSQDDASTAPTDARTTIRGAAAASAPAPAANVEASSGTLEEQAAALVNLAVRDARSRGVPLTRPLKKATGAALRLEFKHNKEHGENALELPCNTGPALLLFKTRRNNKKRPRSACTPAGEHGAAQAGDLVPREAGAAAEDTPASAGDGAIARQRRVHQKVQLAQTGVKYSRRSGRKRRMPSSK